MSILVTGAAGFIGFHLCKKLLEKNIPVIGFDNINSYLNEDCLRVETLGRVMAWLDTGTHEALLEASTFIETIEKRQGLKIGCIEEIAWRSGWITDEDLRRLATPISDVEYGHYLLKLLTE